MNLFNFAISVNKPIIVPINDNTVSTPQKITREEIKKFDENTKNLTELKEIVEKSLKNKKTD